MSTIPDFHPVIQRWWADRIVGPPTAAQARGWPSIRAGGDTLIAAPTGSGKTLAAFLHAIDDLLREGVESGGLPDEVRVIYVSPLKALSADIHRNLAEPRREIRRLAEEMGLPPVRITAATRSGDTPQNERAAMLRRPPHILVTTPESLYLLLTAERSREMLRTARTVIVDEIHAVIETRRGAHLALSLERLDHVAGRRLQRIGLSATQRPIERVAEFLSGAGSAGDSPSGHLPGRESMEDSPRGPAAAPQSRCTIIDEGHVRELDLLLEVPPSPLEAVMSNEVWEELYDRLAALVQEHRTTIVFVNTRRLAERVARHLSDRLGDEAVMPHHGSLAKEARLLAEERLKAGTVRALVATASLELGIDIGHVDLVCQLGSPRRIATFLQRVGRSGHTVHGVPKGRIFPLTRDELVECTALLRSVRAGELDHIIIPPEPVDVLAQQIVAESAAEDWAEDELYMLVRRAHPYRNLERSVFDEIVHMLARGISTHRGRRAAMIHHDAVNGRIRGRKGARILAITSGGAIPDVADYRVVLEPDGTFIGTVNEDFAVESMAGDIFQLGNSAWRVLKLETGVMRVADATGEMPNIPFWLGEAPARSDELSGAASSLRADVDARLAARGPDAAAAYLTDELGVPGAAAGQIVRFLAETKRLLGAVPTQDTIVLERFFDEAGGMQLVLHAPFGARVNRAWGLALRKKFCQSFNFELQAAATDEGVLLSLGPQHSFPLEEVFRYLNPATVRETLVQAMLDSPIFPTRWRWVAMLALAVPRNTNGRRTPPQIQRMISEDLLSSVFPDATACLEHVVGEREVPDHPLVAQAIRDCLEETMDLPSLEGILARVLHGELKLVARDTTEPSPFASEIVNARVYQFLDDAPLEERRTAAVRTRRALDPSSSNDLAALDASAIERVREEAWPAAADADELHDALLTSGFLLEGEVASRGAAEWPPLFEKLVATGRASHVQLADRVIWAAAERLPELRAALPDARPVPDADPPRGTRTEWSFEEAWVELIRSRMDVFGPATHVVIAQWLARPDGDAAAGQAADAALLALENEGRILRGYFTPGGTELEWCDRRLLARIHRYTLDRLRAEIEPVSARDYLRFLVRWQRAHPEQRANGPEGLASVIDQLGGFPAAAAAWEADVLSLRVNSYDPTLLDMLCLSGRIAWGRLGTRRSTSGLSPVRATPLAIAPREGFGLWAHPDGEDAGSLGSNARTVHAVLQERGASFFHDLVAASGLLATQVEAALAELVSAGLATADSFTGLRALLVPESKRASLTGAPMRRRRARFAAYSVANAGRWALLGEGRLPAPGPAERAETVARALLRRYGVVFRRIVARETGAPPWRELILAYRRLEARGEIRGGRFIAGMAGEQFALPEAVGLLRAARREPRDGTTLVISAADPLNLVGIVTPETERVAASYRNRILLRDGAPVAALEGGELRRLSGYGDEPEEELRRALGRSGVAPPLRPYLRADRPRTRVRRSARPAE